MMAIWTEKYSKVDHCARFRRGLALVISKEKGQLPRQKTEKKKKEGSRSRQGFGDLKYIYQT